MTMNKPHKHAELIKAWADGAEIEIKFYNGWRDCQPVDWNENAEFRIKPEPKPDTQYWCRTYEHSGGSIFTPHLLSPTEICPANLKLTFDGETGKLKSAEVL
jgi:hypothetical protein